MKNLMINMRGDLKMKNVLIIGGAGYVGSKLVPNLLEKGHKVTVYDLFLYGDIFKDSNNPNLVQIKGDIRDEEKLVSAGKGIEQVIHLACISNDPSADLDPELTKSINYDAFFNVLKCVEKNNAKRLIFASSASIYGIKEGDVTENSEPDPLTLYAKYKWECEKVLQQTNLEYVAVRPGTICGYAPRLRLDLTVNLLTMHALVNKKIRVFGGKQLRPHINMKDMVGLYEYLLSAPTELIKRQAFNFAYANMSVEDTAKSIINILDDPKVQIEYVPTDDKRSYHLNSEKIKKVLGYEPKYTIQDAIGTVKKAYEEGKIQDGLNNPIYHNVKLMKQANLK